MSSEKPPPSDASGERFLIPERALTRAAIQAIRSRVVSGLILVMPLVITIWVLVKIYEFLRQGLILPIGTLIDKILGEGNITDRLPPAVKELALFVIVSASLIVILYFLGMLLRSRLHRTLDAVLLRVPIVTVVYKAVRNVFESIRLQQVSDRKFRRVVLVAFPHPGMKAPGFVTSTCKDVTTGKTILSVYVPTTPIPTSGYMLLVPEEEVSELDWDTNETLQAIASGGISTPPTVRYYAADHNSSVARLSES